MLASLKRPLRLTTDDYAAIACIPAEAEDADRRMFPRKVWRASVEARRLDHSIPARQQPQLTLDLRDLSVGGLSAITQLPLAKGERVAVFFPGQGIQRGWNACGQVIRCEPTALGYRVALQFDPLPSAA
jgi:PilZ domain-containing protein